MTVSKLVLSKKACRDARGFYAYLEDQQLLIGSEEVCGGSEEMISRAYETMKGTHASAEIIDQLPQLAAMDIDWQAYDVFTFHTSNLWRKAILFVIQMHGFGIELHDPSLPADLADAINAYLKTSFAKLLETQSGLAVEIARITLEESGHSLDEWLAVQEAFLNEIDCQSACGTSIDELCLAIMQQLAQVFDLLNYGPVITEAVRQQLARYGAFEAAVLQAINDHLEHILVALGYDSSGDTLMPADLSAVYGKTVRNWLEIMRQE